MKEVVIARGRSNYPQDRHNEPRTNNAIRIAEILVIDPDGNKLGVMSPDEGREHAEEWGMDLVEVAPQARPPVCKIMDYGKYKYQAAKKKKQSKSDTVTLKTFRMRPNIGDHDLNVKLNHATESLASGDQVKLIMRLRGRERAFTDRWVERLAEIVGDLQELVDRETKVSQHPRSEGRQISALIEPA